MAEARSYSTSLTGETIQERINKILESTKSELNITLNESHLLMSKNEGRTNEDERVAIR